MKKNRLLLLVILISFEFYGYAFSQNPECQDQNLSEFIKNADGTLKIVDEDEEDQEYLNTTPERFFSCIEINGTRIVSHTQWSEPTKIRSGISLIAIDMNGDFAVANNAILAEIVFYYNQKTRVKRLRNGYDVLSKKAYTLGISGIFGYDTNGGLEMGLIVTPFGIDIAGVRISAGIGYKAIDKIAFNNENFFLSIPVSFSLPL